MNTVNALPSAPDAALKMSAVAEEALERARERLRRANVPKRVIACEPLLSSVSQHCGIRLPHSLVRSSVTVRSPPCQRHLCSTPPYPAHPGMLTPTPANSCDGHLRSDARSRLRHVHSRPGGRRSRRRRCSVV